MDDKPLTASDKLVICKEICNLHQTNQEVRSFLNIPKRRMNKMLQRFRSGKKLYGVNDGGRPRSVDDESIEAIKMQVLQHKNNSKG